MGKRGTRGCGGQRVTMKDAARGRGGHAFAPAHRGGTRWSPGRLRLCMRVCFCFIRDAVIDTR